MDHSDYILLPMGNMRSVPPDDFIVQHSTGDSKPDKPSQRQSSVAGAVPKMADAFPVTFSLAAFTETIYLGLGAVWALLQPGLIIFFRKYVGESWRFKEESDGREDPENDPELPPSSSAGMSAKAQSHY